MNHQSMLKSGMGPDLAGYENIAKFRARVRYPVQHYMIVNIW